MQERWRTFSLAEQLGNVGSEINRALNWENKDKAYFERAIERSLELLDGAIADVRWRGRLRELVRAREILCDAATGGKTYGTSLQDLNHYFLSFAIAARIQR